MPATNRTNTGFVLTYNVFKGKFTRKAPDNYDGDLVIERVNQNGKAVRELHYDKLEGIVLADIKEVEHDEYGKSYEFFFIDENEYIKLKVHASSSVASGILVRLENVILDKPLAIEIYFFPKDDEHPKDRTTLNIYQDDKKLERVYTKDNPGKLPQPIQTTLNNKLVWDWTEQMNYWSALIKSIASELPGVHQESATVAQEQDTAQPAATPPPSQQSPPVTQDEDDLPF